MSYAQLKQGPASFILPDLVQLYKLAYHPAGDDVAKQSAQWLDAGCPGLNSKQRRALYGLQVGELTAFCYNTVDTGRLRIVSDFMNYLFHLDKISDGLMTRETDVLANAVMNAFRYPDSFTPTEDCPKELNPAKVARDFWSRCVKDCGPGAQARFKETMGLFFAAVNIEAKARDSNKIPDLESYIKVNRDTSGKYALGIDLPDFVAEDLVIQSLNEYAIDLVTWTNDIFSYNVEQARGDTHNMVDILMKYHNHTLESAMDYVGKLCSETMNNFERRKSQVPSWGPEIDDMVARYIQGLRNFTVGSLHWSFQTHHYFGDHGKIVKKQRLVHWLLPSKTNINVIRLLINRFNRSLSSMTPLLPFKIDHISF
ncbi:hypothetical protein AGABI2DRAFT_144791 [Agaricus bisporus var. bisporus H97]|uniref:hypothetical protein n=1 Tax=Agaricus bisporus var. bisporus (strain H97 / ATCC MYA-4626 / FGSC 10389) TaxID=936046 RepID=UPI00029F6A78|nr:hypothetical protein AGABI2DRAFT_144791 [Agaricus bisporus var. bisporus H97]EKV45354.1 hypothetical protein AGABI2DRAFT_144791 [Agaricus bisporus var. bisporus H97]